MNNTITANELKIKGVTAISNAIKDENCEVFITVHGKNKYVVVPIEQYNYLRECELEAALLEARNDLKTGNYFIESVDEHIERITRG